MDIQGEGQAYQDELLSFSQYPQPVALLCRFTGGAASLLCCLVLDRRLRCAALFCCRLVLPRFARPAAVVLRYRRGVVPRCLVLGSIRLVDILDPVVAQGPVDGDHAQFLVLPDAGAMLCLGELHSPASHES